MRNYFLFLFILISCAANAKSQPTTIYLNQLGYFPYQEKVAVIEGSTNFFKKYVVRNSAGNPVLKGRLLKTTHYKSSFSNDKAFRIDMSSIIRPGEYTLEINDTKAKFVINNNVLQDVCKASIKAFYYQRASMPIEARYAGQWSRPAAHMDTEVLVHPSAATSTRPAGTKISSPKGWYDAGDYNKYIVNSGFCIGQMLNIYPLVENYLRGLNINIPESGNGAPDILNEIFYNLEWMLTMQDTDGGLYHKLTTPNFESFIMPNECKQTRYVVQKSTCATLDFAASMAMASRIYKPYEKQFPNFSEKALTAAKKAYLWAMKNPNVMYNQNELNKNFSPKINTGTYGDFSAKDEFFWAAMELYLTTGNTDFLKEAESYMPQHFTTPTWGNVGTLGMTSFLMHYKTGSKMRSPEVVAVENKIKEKLVEWADEYIKRADNSMFFAPFGNKKSDFHWASIAEGAATDGVLLIQAYIVTKDKKYLKNARRNADYMFGRNPLQLCFVTGFGEHSPQHPHHRVSASDGIKAPIPGLLVGGPNATANEGNYYNTEQPDKRYADNQESYTTNEVAINWNSALVAFTSALQTLWEH